MEEITQKLKSTIVGCDAIWVPEGSPEWNMSWEELIKQPLDVIYIVRRQVER